MIAFRYYARTTNGEPVKGILEATSKDEVVDKLRDKKLIVISIEELKQKASVVELFDKRKIPVKDLAVFCRQLSTMLNAGLPLLNCLVILKKQTDNKKLSSIIDLVSLAVQGGESLGNAFRRHKEIPEIMVSMIDVGELGGVLDEVLARLATHLEKEHGISEKVKSAMTYPMVVLGIAFVAVIALMTFVIPAFRQILADIGVEMPLVTRLLLGISDWMVSYWYILALLFISMGYGMGKLLQTEQGRTFKDKAILRFPVFGSLNQKVIISRFTRTLGTLLKGGVPIITALEVVKKVVNNVIVAEELSQAQVNIRNGGGMAGPLAKSSFFTPMVVQMVAIGEETGRLDSMLERVSDFYDAEVESMVSRLSGLLEPMMILFLGGIIGTIILAIMLPMFSIIGTM